MVEAVPGASEPTLALSPHWTVGDRLVGFRVLLPAQIQGPVLLATGPDLALQLRELWPDATILDGAAAPPTPGPAALLVLESGRMSQTDAAALVHPGGHLVTLSAGGSRRSDVTLYPDGRSPEMLWRRGWPVTVSRGPLSTTRRWFALHRQGGASTSMSISGPSAATLADEVLADLGRQLGGGYDLRGVVTAGRTVLRAVGRQGTPARGTTLAVSLDLTGHGERSGLVDLVAEQVPGLDRHLVTTVAAGTTQGVPWRAAPWMGSPGHRPWVSARRRMLTARTVADLLAAQTTGHTAPGWAREWCRAVELLPPEAQERWVRALEPLERGLPTGWCHGDLWPGNVLAGREGLAVIDWDNASPDAPLGLDRLLLGNLGDQGDGTSTARRLVRLLDDESEAVAALEVAGRPLAAWDPATRAGLVVAAVGLHLRNRSASDLDPRELQTDLDDVDAALEALAAEDAGTAASPAASAAGRDPLARGVRARDEAGRGEAVRTARGAIWLATNGIVVKASQTIVLLILAASLAPSALGLVALGTLVANVSAVLSSLGVASALVYWRGDVQRAARTSVTISVVTALVLTALLWVGAPALVAALHGADGGVAVVRGLVVTLPCLAISGVTNELLRRRLAFARRIIPDATSSVVGAVVAIVLVTHGHGVMALVVGQVVQGVLAMLLAWVVHPPVLPGWNTADARALLAYGGPYSGTNLLEIVQLNVDYLVVSRVLGAVALGQYSLGFRIAFMPYLMIVVVTTGAAFPYLCRVRGPALARAVELVTASTMALVVPSCVLLMLLSDHLTILGEQWRPAVPVLCLLAGYGVLLGVTQVVLVALNGAGRPGLAMSVKLLHLLVLTLVLLLVVHHGVKAVALAQLLVVAAITLVALVVLHRQVPGLSLRRAARALRPTVLGTALMSLVIIGLRAVAFGGGPSVLSLLALGSAGAITFVASAWLFDRAVVTEAMGVLRGTT